MRICSTVTDLAENYAVFRNIVEDVYDMAVSYTKLTELVEKKKYWEEGKSVECIVEKLVKCFGPSEDKAKEYFVKYRQ